MYSEETRVLLIQRGSLMLKLVVAGPEPGQRWTRSIEDGAVVLIGRKPKEGWAVPWDNHISREHVEIVLEGDRLAVRCLDSAKNPVYFHGKPVTELTVEPGEKFRIGNTNFELADANAKPKPEKPAKKAKMLGKYALVKKLGEGGMGAVFLATDTQLKRQVALKILSKDAAKDTNAIKRFKSEAQAAALLQHKNIITTYEAGEDKGQMFIALEFVDGIDVDKLIKQRGAIDQKRSLDIIKQVTDALRHAYDRKIVHRDIKPSNLMITKDGTVKLADMGLARSMEESVETGITRAGTTVGTVDYMSPEQTRDSRSADIRSDIYSLGCTWYQMLTGGPPFPDGSLTNKLQAHATTPPPNPRDKNEDIPEATVAIIHRMMAKKPDDRYQTPTELMDDLENVNRTDEAVTDMLLAAMEEDDFDDEDDDSQKSSERTIEEKTAKTKETRPKTAVIQVACKKCSASYKVSAKNSGKRMKCKQCGSPITVPKKKK